MTTKMYWLFEFPLIHDKEDDAMCLM
jgi:hypothetical protein